MFCKSNCFISIIFLISMIYMQMKMPYGEKQKYFNLLNDKQKEKYISIKNFRLKLYFKGYFIGLILALIFISFNIYKNNFKIKPSLVACTVTAIMFLFQYFYYIISPKPDYMILHLKTKDQKEAWLKIYRAMQLNYHLGFVIGIFAVTIFSLSFRKY